MFCERGIFASARVRFSEAFDAGGEDTDVIHRLARSGARFVWSKQAVVFEEVTDSRMRLAFWLRRAFRGGFRHTRVYGLGSPLAVTQTASISAAKAVSLSVLLIPSCVVGRFGFVKTAIPWAASLGALTACADHLLKRNRRAFEANASSSVLLVGPTPPPHHGVSMAVQALLDSNMCEAFRVRHLDLADRRGIQHVDRPDFRDVLLFVGQWRRMIILLLRERAHLVYIPLSQTTIGFLRDSLLMWPAYLLGARVVFHLHGGQLRAWYEARSGLLKAYIRLVLRCASRVVVLGDSLRPIFEGLVAPKRIDVVPNGVADLPHQIEGGAGGCLRVLHLGTLSRAKGTLVLLDTAARILASRRDAEFVFAGPWLREQDRRDAEGVMTRSGLAEHVVFTGQVDASRKEELLASSDVFVFAGVQQEGQPLVVLEAMAAGLPVVFTDRGCLRETVVDGATGCEVRINDPSDLARTLLWLFDHPGERQRLGAAARRRYETLYTLDRHVERMTDVFSRTFQEGR